MRFASVKDGAAEAGCRGRRVVGICFWYAGIIAWAAMQAWSEL